MMFILLLIPTALMGGTLPILVHYTKKYHVNFSHRLGYLYGLNTFGAALGVLGSGIYSIGELGEDFTLVIGVLINLCVSLLAFSFSRVNSNFETEPLLDNTQRISEGQKISTYNDYTRKRILFAYALSGFTALSYEIVWTRMLQIHVGTSIYAFSLMLTFYLIGIALGSIWGGKFIANRKDLITIFALSQLFIAFYSIIGLYFLALFNPWYSRSFYFGLSYMLILPISIIIPITFMLGFIFPLISKIYVKDEARSASGVGQIYSVNTFGCILGSLISGFLFISIFGTRGTVLLLATINVLIGLVIFYKSNILVVGMVIIIFVTGFFAPDPFLASVKKLLGKNNKDAEIFYHKEDVAATTTVIGVKNYPLAKQLLINGIGMTRLCTETKLMAHLPILVHQNPKDMLVICFGMGTTLRSAWVHKNLKCDVVELVPEVYKCFKYFHSNGPEILQDPRVHHYIDDGRNFLLLNSKKYDIITMDPSPPLWSAGTVNLYTKEFFELCKSHLNPNGVMCLWVPPEKISEVIMIMRTFYAVFPNTYVYRGSEYPGIYMLGLCEPATIKPDRFIRANQDKNIVQDIHEWNNLVPRPEEMLNLLVLTPQQLSALVEGVRVITDNHPYTEFPLWRSIFDKMYGNILDGNLLIAWRKQKFGK